MNRLAPVLPAVLPAVALAHEAEHRRALEILRWWTLDPLVLGTVALAAVVYGVGARRVWGRAGVGHGVHRWEAAAYGLGLLSVLLALVSPLDRLSDILFSAHMSQHEILMLVSAPLLVLGRPWIPFLWALPVSWRERVRSWWTSPGVSRVWRVLSGPVFVVVLHGAVRWAWHAPVLFEAALENETVHTVQHLTFFFSAALFWLTLVHGRYGRAGYGIAFLFVFFTAMHSGVLAALLTLAQSSWYPSHEMRTREWGMDPREDQQLAGLIMWIPAAALLFVIALALFAAWLGESERRAARARVRGLVSHGDDARG